MRIAISVVIVLILATASRAQHSTSSTGFFSGSYKPAYSARDVQVMVRVLDLRPDEEEALRALYSSYAEAVRTEGNAAQAFVNVEIERAEIMNDQRLLAPVHQRLGEWRERSDELKDTFLEDLKSLLTSEQESRWPLLERELRRVKQIGRGSLTGESVDIVRLAEDAFGERPIPPAVTELLARYREDIDRALAAREAFMEGDAKEFDAAVKDNLDRATSLWKEARDRRRLVRDTNERYARLIAAEMPTDLRDGFETQVFRQSFPMLVRESRVDELLRGALELPDVSAEQRSELEAIKARYERQTLAWARVAAAGWRAFEEEMKPQSLARALGEDTERNQQRFNGNGLPEAHPLQEARVKRFEQDRAARAAIEALLSDEQRYAIPSTRSGTARFEDWAPWGL